MKSKLLMAAATALVLTLASHAAEALTVYRVCQESYTQSLSTPALRQVVPAYTEAAGTPNWPSATGYTENVQPGVTHDFSGQNGNPSAWCQFPQSFTIGKVTLNLVGFSYDYQVGTLPTDDPTQNIEIEMQFGFGSNFTTYYSNVPMGGSPILSGSLSYSGDPLMINFFLGTENLSDPQFTTQNVTASFQAMYTTGGAFDPKDPRYMEKMMELYHPPYYLGADGHLHRDETIVYQ